MASRKKGSGDVDLFYTATLFFYFVNEQGGIRTPDLLIRSQKLYPLSYLSRRVFYNNTSFLKYATKFFDPLKF
jgi:hypothetical protein